VRLDAVLDPASKSPTVSAEELTNKKSQLDLVTVTVGNPPPTELWIAVRLTSTKGFTDGPVAVRARVVREKDVLTTFAVVLGEDAATKPFETKLDVLKGLSSVPETMLVHAEAEIILLPKGEDPAKININTVAGTPDTTGAILGNPVRINFAKPDKPAGGQ
jgi:hypothetical protein